MKIISFDNFLNEAKTLFGETVEGRLAIAEDLAKENNWKSEKSHGGFGDVPKEVKELWGNTADSEKAKTKMSVLRIWVGQDRKVTHSEFLKMIADKMIGKEKGWVSSPIKMIDGYGAKKSENKAQTFTHPTLGTITIQVKTVEGRRFEIPTTMVFIYALKDAVKHGRGNLKPELLDKTEELVAGLSKEDKIAIIQYLKDKYTDYTDSI